MADNTPPQKTERADRIVRGLSAVIKNTSIYPQHHPLLDSSINTFIDALSTWLDSDGDLAIAIQADDLLFGGTPLKEKSELYRELADYLHRKGLIAITFRKEVTTEEVVTLIRFVTSETARDPGTGELILPPAMPHIEITALDYSVLLREGMAERRLSDEELWDALASLGKRETLPESRGQFISTFLKHPDRSAQSINKLFRSALKRTDEAQAADHLRSGISDVVRHCETSDAGDAIDAKKKLADIVSRLDPALIERLFEPGAGAGAADLYDDILGEFSDEMIADFMASIVKNAGSLNEHILRLFDNISKRSDASRRIAEHAAHKIVENELAVNMLTDLKTSIKDLFEIYPTNDFMSSMYKMTVEALATDTDGQRLGIDQHRDLVRDHQALMTPPLSMGERLRLICNVMWLERNPADFKELASLLVDSVRDCLDIALTRYVREAFELFDRLHPDQRSQEEIADAARSAVAALSGADIVSPLAAMIERVNLEGLDDLAYVMTVAQKTSCRILAHALASCADPDLRTRYKHIMARMSASAASDILAVLDEHIDERGSAAVTDLFDIIRQLDPDLAQASAGKIIAHQDASTRAHVLETFRPRTVQDKHAVLDALKRERSAEYRSKIIAAIAKSCDAEMVDGLFSRFRCGPFSINPTLVESIRLLGDNRCRPALPHLMRILSMRPLFRAERFAGVKVAAAITLGQIGGAEAEEALRRGLDDRSESVRRMCRYIIDSVEAAKDAAPSQQGESPHGR